MEGPTRQAAATRLRRRRCSAWGSRRPPQRRKIRVSTASSPPTSLKAPSAHRAVLVPAQAPEDFESRLAAAPSARAPEPQGEQEHDRSDRGVDDEAEDAGAEMNSEAMQKPVADEGADDADRRIADEAEPLPRTTLPANHPATRPTTQMTINPWSDRCMLFPPSVAVVRSLRRLAPGAKRQIVRKDARRVRIRLRGTVTLPREERDISRRRRKASSYSDSIIDGSAHRQHDSAGGRGCEFAWGG